MIRRTLRLLLLLGIGAFLFLFFSAQISYAIACHQMSQQALKELKDHYNVTIPDANGNPALPFYPILMTAYRHPEYLKKSLEGLARVSNIEQTILVVSQDGDDEEVSKMIREVKTPSRVILFRHHRPYFSLPSLFVSNEYGTSANIKFLLTFAFEYLGAPAAIVLESDLVPSADFYDYFTWAFHHFFFSLDPLHAGKVMSICSFNMNSRPGMDPAELTLGRFQVWGWGTSKEMWSSVIKGGWTWFQGWDGAVQRQRIKKKLYSVAPRLSRVRNVGMIGVNFQVTDPEQLQKWAKVYISPDPISYQQREPKVVEIKQNYQVF